MPQANAICSAFDQAWDIRHDEALLIIRLDHAQHRRNCRERIIRNLRSRCGHIGNKAGLSDAWISHKPDISQKLQFQDEVPALSRLPKFCESRRTIGRIREFRIAAPAAPAFGHGCLLPHFREIRYELARVIVKDHRSGRNLHDTGRSIAPILVLNVAVFPVFPLEFPSITEIQKRVHIPVHLKNDVSASPTVSAGRAALGDELLPPEGRLSVTAVTRLDRNPRPIDKLHSSPLPSCIRLP